MAGGIDMGKTGGKGAQAALVAAVDVNGKVRDPSLIIPALLLERKPAVFGLLAPKSELAERGATGALMLATELAGNVEKGKKMLQEMAGKRVTKHKMSVCVEGSVLVDGTLTVFLSFRNEGNSEEDRALLVYAANARVRDAKGNEVRPAPIKSGVAALFTNRPLHVLSPGNELRGSLIFEGVGAKDEHELSLTYHHLLREGGKFGAGTADARKTEYEFRLGQ